MSGPIHKRVDKEFRPFVKQLKRIEGIELKPKGRGKHVKVYYHGVRVASVPGSCSDVRGLDNLRAQLRQNGVPIPD